LKNDAYLNFLALSAVDSPSSMSRSQSGDPLPRAMARCGV